MKQLILLRHGQASSESQYQDDFERPLDDVGRKAVELQCQNLKRLSLSGKGLVICSPARRTRQTLEAVTPALPESFEITYEDDLYLASQIYLINRLKLIQDTFSQAFLISHNPGLEQLIGWLVDTRDHGSFQLSKSLPTATLAVLSLPIHTWADLERRKATLVNFITPST